MVKNRVDNWRLASSCIAMNEQRTSAGTRDNDGRCGTTDTSYASVAKLRGVKVPGFDHLYARFNCYADSGTGTANIVTVNASQSFTFTTGAVKTFRIDVSGVADETTISVSVQAKHSTGGASARVGTSFAWLSPRGDLLATDYTLTY